MLSYLHAYHAGNKADVLKHAILYNMLGALADEDRSTLYVETHSGRAQYDLTGVEAEKTGEAKEGVLSMLKVDLPAPLRDWTDFVKKTGPGAYPGSPMIASNRLSKADRMVFFELHPNEHKVLQSTIGKDDRALVKKADGYAGALRLAPRRSERMIVFVDPSYESLKDMDALAEWTPRALRRWPEAVLILWLPLFRDEREVDFGAFLAELENGVVAGARWKTDPLDETALAGSAIVAYRVPQKVADTSLSIATSLQNYWSAQ